MHRTHRFSLLMLTALTLMATPPAFSQALIDDDDGRDPQAIAAHCVREIHAITEKCIEANLSQARHCVKAIERLIAEGRIAMAHELAEACIIAINERSWRCVGVINTLTHRCVFHLVFLQAPHLAQAVHMYGDYAMRHVMRSRSHAVRAIRTALPL